MTGATPQVRPQDLPERLPELRGLRKLRPRLVHPGATLEQPRVVGAHLLKYVEIV